MLKLGHVSAMCMGMDRSSRCFQCGEEKYLAREMLGEREEMRVVRCSGQASGAQNGWRPMSPTAGDQKR